MARILLAEDDEIMRITLYDRLIGDGWDVDQARDGKDAYVKIKQESYHLVISDIRMPGLDGISLLEKIRQTAPQTDVILMTAFGGVDDAVNCLKKGAADYILKPFDMDDLAIRVNRLLETQAVKAKCAALEAAVRGPELVSRSPAMKGIHQLIASVAPSDSSVLITGASGTGKELVAEAIHLQSQRAKGPYIKINCAAIPESLIESELFGHEKGAFTGAEQRKLGKFAQADGGSLLLDEIGDMPLNLQVKLLRVLQEKEVEPIGGSKPLAVDVRIICSTSKDLATEVEQGNFRNDLYYRLKVIPIELPPLTNRKEDIPELCDNFLNEFSQFHGMPLELSPAAMEVLMAYDYPGNVRELRNIIERVSVLATTPLITVEQLPLDLQAKQKKTLPESYNLAGNLAVVEREVIQKALHRTNGRKTEAAKLLGISRKNLWEKLKQLG